MKKMNREVEKAEKALSITKYGYDPITSSIILSGELAQIRRAERIRRVQ